MNQLFFVCGLLLLSAGARAQQAAPAAEVAFTRNVTGCPVSAELNKYEIRRSRKLGVITARDAREIKARKRQVARQVAEAQRAAVAQWKAPAVEN